MDDDEIVMISALEHISFCPRRFALLYLDGVWRDDARTTQGRILHDNAHDPYFTEKRKDLLITRAVPLRSEKLGIAGEADVVEFRRGEVGATLAGQEGLWQPTPVEYKKGRPSEQDHDCVQLCAQALCLEEMLAVSIPKASIFYWEIRSRIEVELDEPLRQTTRERIALAKRILFEKHLPPVQQPKRVCKSCSIEPDCLPSAHSKKHVAHYIDGAFGEVGP